jgi:hypothetical protein
MASRCAELSSRLGAVGSVELVGADVGAVVFPSFGASVGCTVGAAVVGASVGAPVGASFDAPATVGSSVGADVVGASVGPAVGASVVGATVGADVSGIDVATRLELLKPADAKLTLSAASNDSWFMTGTDKSVPSATGTDVSTTTSELRLTGCIVTLLLVMS